MSEDSLEFRTRRSSKELPLTRSAARVTNGVSEQTCGTSDLSDILGDRHWRQFTLQSTAQFEIPVDSSCEAGKRLTKHLDLKIGGAALGVRCLGSANGRE